MYKEVVIDGQKVDVFYRDGEIVLELCCQYGEREHDFNLVFSKEELDNFYFKTKQLMDFEDYFFNEGDKEMDEKEMKRKLEEINNCSKDLEKVEDNINTLKRMNSISFGSDEQLFHMDKADNEDIFEHLRNYLIEQFSLKQKNIKEKLEGYFK